MSYYIFKITYYDDYKNKEIQTNGLVAADSFSEAMKAITNDWGENSIMSLDLLMPIEELSETLTLNEAMFHMFFNGNNETKIESYHLAKKNPKGEIYFDFPEEEGEFE